MLHCCGSISILLPLMIKAGLDGIHALQPDCYGMDLSKLKSDPDYVRKETKMVLDIMAPGGGYVAGASHDYILEETPFENILAMFDTISEYRTD